MKILFSGCFLLFSIVSMAQVNLDSLLTVWNDPDQHDTTRLKAIHQMTQFGYQFSQPDSAFYFAQLEYDFAEQIELKSYMADALNIQGISMSIQSEYLSALDFFERSLVINEETGNKKKISKSLNNIGIAYAELGDTFRSIDYFTRSLSINEKLADKKEISNSLNNIGSIHLSQNDYVSAMDYYERSLALEEEIGEEIRIGGSLLDIGIAYYHQENYATALTYLTRGFTIYEKFGREWEMALGLDYIGNVYRVQGDFAKAKDYYARSMALSKKMGLKSQICTTLINFASIYKMEGDSASTSGRSKERYDKAIEYSTRAIKIAQKIGDAAEIRDAANSLYETYQATAQYERALEMHKLFISKKDIILSEENQKEIIRQRYKHDYEKQKLSDDIAHGAELENEVNQRYALYIILTILAVFALFMYRAWKIRKKLSEKIEESYEKLQELNEYKESMTAMINHDLRTPLTLINGYVLRIIENDNNYLSNESIEDLNNLKQNSVKLAEMSEEMQDLLLLDEGRLELNFAEVEMNTYLETLVKMFFSAASESGVSLEFKSKVKGDLLIRLDHQHFDKIVYNLLINAIRYTGEGGRINVTLNNTTTHCEISIEDTGKGISVQHLPMIFDRLYQSKNNQSQGHKGYGIGLAVVKELVELHGGEVTAESELDKGTIIYLSLPFNLDKEIQEEWESTTKDLIPKLKSVFIEASNSMVGKEESSMKQTVLIVDDQEEIRTYISDIIRSDYHVKNAANGKQALKILEKEEINLIITDLMMPWLDGFELIESIRQNDQMNHIPIMVVSGRTTEEDKLKILDQGVNNFMSKPFNPIELKKRIYNLLNASEDQHNSWDHIIGDKDLLSNIEHNILKKLNQIIIDHIDSSSLTIELLADQLSASRSKTIKMIKSLTGQTPLAYIKSIRMDYVSNLINKKKVKNTSEAAYAIGMKNATQFSQQYQKHFGEPPF